MLPFPPSLPRAVVDAAPANVGTTVRAELVEARVVALVPSRSCFDWLSTNRGDAESRTSDRLNHGERGCPRLRAIASALQGVIPFALSLSKRGIWQSARSGFDGLSTNGGEAESRPSARPWTGGGANGNASLGTQTEAAETRNAASTPPQVRIGPACCRHLFMLFNQRSTSLVFRSM